jgi:hypothetical protein
MGTKCFCFPSHAFEPVAAQLSAAGSLGVDGICSGVVVATRALDSFRYAFNFLGDKHA